MSWKVLECPKILFEKKSGHHDKTKYKPVLNCPIVWFILKPLVSEDEDVRKTSLVLYDFTSLVLIHYHCLITALVRYGRFRFGMTTAATIQHGTSNVSSSAAW